MSDTEEMESTVHQIHKTLNAARGLANERYALEDVFRWFRDLRVPASVARLWSPAWRKAVGVQIAKADNHPWRQSELERFDAVLLDCVVTSQGNDRLGLRLCLDIQRRTSLDEASEELWSQMATDQAAVERRSGMNAEAAQCFLNFMAKLLEDDVRANLFEQQLYRLVKRSEIEAGPEVRTLAVAEMFVRYGINGETRPTLLGFDVASEVRRVLSSPADFVLAARERGFEVTEMQLKMLANNLKQDMISVSHDSKLYKFLEIAASRGDIASPPSELWADSGFASSIFFAMQTVEAVRHVPETSYLFEWWRFWGPIKNRLGARGGCTLLVGGIAMLAWLLFKLF